jgi:ABC-type Fe3+ transport system permease subunit
MFFLKGTVFAALAWTIWYEHRQARSRPTRIGREMIRMFLSIAFTSAMLSAIFGLIVWSFRRGELPPPPDWVRWFIRCLLLLSPALVVAFGVLTFRSVRDEARYRAKNGGPLPGD